MTTKMLLIGFLFGIGFGFFVQRAGLCFSHGFAEVFLGRGKRIFRLFLTVFIITCSGFFLSQYVSDSCGLKAIGQLRGYGFYNLLSGILFGMGILISGGCILGTLRQIGEGNMTFVLVLLSFIPGMALVVYVLNPLLESGYHVQKVLLTDLIPCEPVYIVGTLVLLAMIWLVRLLKDV